MALKRASISKYWCFGERKREVVFSSSHDTDLVVEKDSFECYQTGIQGCPRSWIGDNFAAEE